MDTDFHKIYINEICTNEDADIIIGDHVWIVARSTVLKGAVVPSNCVIAAGKLKNVFM